jgi:hypothetical protein
MAGHSNSSVFRSTSSQKRRATTPSTPPQPPRALSGISGCTPISNKISGTHTYSSEKFNRHNYQLAEETRSLFLGAMPPDKFLDEFLPLSQDDSKCPDSREAFAGVVRETRGRKVVMYAPFVSIVLISASATGKHPVDRCSETICPQLQVHRYKCQSGCPARQTCA